MPIYEYTCRKCGGHAELLVRSDAPPECPQCGSAQLEKLLSIVAAPARGDGSASADSRPAGSCGSGCACHPH